MFHRPSRRCTSESSHLGPSGVQLLFPQDVGDRSEPGRQVPPVGAGRQAEDLGGNFLRRHRSQVGPTQRPEALYVRGEACKVVTVSFKTLEAQPDEPLNRGRRPQAPTTRRRPARRTSGHPSFGPRRPRADDSCRSGCSRGARSIPSSRPSRPIRSGSHTPRSRPPRLGCTRAGWAPGPGDTSAARPPSAPLAARRSGRRRLRS